MHSTRSASHCLIKAKLLLNSHHRARAGRQTRSAASIIFFWLVAFHSVELIDAVSRRRRGASDVHRGHALSLRQRPETSRLQYSVVKKTRINSHPPFTCTIGEYEEAKCLLAAAIVSTYLYTQYIRHLIFGRNKCFCPLSCTWRSQGSVLLGSESLPAD